MAETVESIVCYAAWSGDGDGSYDEYLVFDDWPEAAADIKAALDRGRSVLIERTWMTRAEFDEGGPATDEEVACFRGDRAAR